MKRTTNECKADALLEAAMAWQARESRHSAGVTDGPQSGTDDFWAPDESDLNFNQCCDDSASCALSEVAGMGFDLLNDDGTECAKVAEVDWPRSDDANRYIMRPVLR